MTTDTAAETATKTAVAPQQRHRRMRALGSALQWTISKLQREYLEGRPAARAELARLRRGLGKPAGSVPEIWETTIGAVPEQLAGTDEHASRAEQAAHAALTLYAVHQQSRQDAMHVPGTSFGRAVRYLASRPEVSEDAVERRFMAVATAETIDEILVHVRGLVTQLKACSIGLDYAAFADDIHGLLTPGWATGVRLTWGRDFHRVHVPSSSETADDAPSTSTDSDDE
ncbi:type I-E CRISPR-associated protein Cse2/CasB [Actinobacteria bacterium YIM 96077]|uniref:Type I-E CRISPR-associated protein Cse2/CasB n=2 Tax=Phytoactinopolyspora halophila TaxID=1981511 RepID=A0A329QK31_9ACTN|nr:type I-E CRISPR-associated protein Cse2/CasB [Actinobacteria bacterium YIM 96077]RAW12049.1 type I-E CRISPR-associated protein Cse2/CasB [Phytoactinopolyspora halophila]